VMLRPRAGTAMMHHGDVRHAGDRIESGERIQLVAFFYGGERRGNALPLANPHKSFYDTARYGEAPPTSEEIIASAWPKTAMRDPNGKPLTASTTSSSTSKASTSSTSSTNSSLSRRSASPSPSAGLLSQRHAPPPGQPPVGLIERAMLESMREISLDEVAKLAMP